MGANRHVMGNLDQIVDFGALLDDRLAECGSVDRNIRPKLDIILDCDSAELGNFIMLVLVLRIAEPIASDYRTAVNDHPRSDRTAFPDDDVGIQQRIVSDRRIVANKHTGVERHSRANRHPVSQGDSRPDRDIGTNLSVNATYNGRSNATGRGEGAKEGPRDLRKGQCGIGDDDVGIGDLSEPPVSEEYSGSGGPALPEHPIPGNEGQILRAGHFKTGKARDGDLSRPYKFSTDHIVDLFQ